MPGTESIRDQIRDLIDAEPTTGRSGEVADQILSLMPVWGQMEDLINMAYQMGWQDRQHAVFRKDPPTVTIQHTPGVGIVFLYDGKPRS